MVCNRHHHAVHEGGFTAARSPAGIAFRRPDGRPVEVPYRHRVA